MAKIILFNKPFNVLCQFTDKENRPTLADFIAHKNVYPAGRLDYDSEGLLLLTDDGQLQHQISHPKTKMNKTYWVQVEGEPSEKDLQPLINGVTLNDGPCRPAQVQIIDEPAIWPRTPPIRARENIPTRWLKITISEGRNRQVRRMTAAIGFPTLRLIRASIGDWHLNQLQPGEFTEITLHAAHKKSSKPHLKSRRPATRRPRKL